MRSFTDVTESSVFFHVHSGHSRSEIGHHTNRNLWYLDLEMDNLLDLTLLSPSQRQVILKLVKPAKTSAVPDLEDCSPKTNSDHEEGDIIEGPIEAEKPNDPFLEYSHFTASQLLEKKKNCKSNSAQAALLVSTVSLTFYMYFSVKF